MIENLPNEKWRRLTFEGSDILQKKYMVSNMGRIASYVKSLKKDGTILKASTTEGYSILRLRIHNQYAAFLVHRAVAGLFLKRKSPKFSFVIHQNFDKKDNRFSNLKWATREDVTAHNLKNPAVIAAKQRQREKPVEMKKGLKLTLAQVKQIKRTLANPKRKLTYKQLADKYGISEMAITRIKRGENWGSVSI